MRGREAGTWGSGATATRLLNKCSVERTMIPLSELGTAVGQGLEQVYHGWICFLLMLLLHGVIILPTRGTFLRIWPVGPGTSVSSPPDWNDCEVSWWMCRIWNYSEVGEISACSQGSTWKSKAHLRAFAGPQLRLAHCPGQSLGPASARSCGSCPTVTQTRQVQQAPMQAPVFIKNNLEISTAHASPQ